MISRVRGLWSRLPGPGWMVLALVAGFVIGVLIEGGRPGLVDASRLVGSLWLDALRMTIVPLVFALVLYASWAGVFLVGLPAMGGGGR